MTLARSSRGRGSSALGADPARGPTSSRAVPLPHPRSSAELYNQPSQPQGPASVRLETARETEEITPAAKEPTGTDQRSFEHLFDWRAGTLRRTFMNTAGPISGTCLGVGGGI